MAGGLCLTARFFPDTHSHPHSHTQTQHTSVHTRLGVGEEVFPRDVCDVKVRFVGSERRRSAVEFLFAI